MLFFHSLSVVRDSEKILSPKKTTMRCASDATCCICSSHSTRPTHGLPLGSKENNSSEQTVNEQKFRVHVLSVNVYVSSRNDIIILHPIKSGPVHRTCHTCRTGWPVSSRIPSALQWAPGIWAGRLPQQPGRSESCRALSGSGVLNQVNLELGSRR